jgi:hypothetical protein
LKVFKVIPRFLSRAFQRSPRASQIHPANSQALPEAPKISQGSPRHSQNLPKPSIASPSFPGPARGLQKGPPAFPELWVEFPHAQVPSWGLIWHPQNFRFSSRAENKPSQTIPEGSQTCAEPSRISKGSQGFPRHPNAFQSYCNEMRLIISMPCYRYP